MRLLRLTTNYPAYLNRFYSQHSQLALQPYALQHTALMNDSFAQADFWSAALANLGYSTRDIVANAKPMQRQWAKEAGLTVDESNWLLIIAASQIKVFRPDVLFINDYYTFDVAFLRQLKSECPSIKLVLGWCGAPYSDPSVFREYDIVLSCVPELVHHFRDNGHRTYHLNQAFEPRILERIDTKRPCTAEFTFIGSIVRQKNFHNQRATLLLELLKETNLQVWLPRPSLQSPAMRIRQLAYDTVQIARTVGIPQSVLTVTPVVGKVARWDRRPGQPREADDLITRRAQPPLFGLAMYQKLYESKVALNTHIDISPISASNMRLFEATGVGACLLTDWKANLPSLFEPDVEIVSYRNIDECIEKVSYLLDHDNERERIAVAGQRRTLADHTYARRAEDLDQIVRDALRRDVSRRKAHVVPPSFS